MFDMPGRKIFFAIAMLIIALIPLQIVTAASDSKLILLSPHSEGIRTEFTDAFQKWYKACLLYTSPSPRD